MTAIPTELAVLMVGIAARQAASPTAQLQAALDRPLPADALFAPAHGAFNRAMEATLDSGTDPLPRPATRAHYSGGGRAADRAGAASPVPTLTGWQEP